MTDSNGPSDDTIAAYAAQLLDLESEIEKKQADKKDVYTNARDTYGKRFANSLKLAIKRHRMDSEKRTEADEIDADAERMLAIIGQHRAPRATRSAITVPDHDAKTGEIIEPDEPQPPPEATVNPAAHIETPAEESSLAQEPSEPEGSGGMQDELAIHPPTHSNPAEVPPLPSAVGGGDRSAILPDAAPVVPSNTITFHDPATHFLNSKGLTRLHGCQGPEACASSQPRVKLCFACSVAHDGPVASEASA